MIFRKKNSISLNVIKGITIVFTAVLSVSCEKYLDIKQNSSESLIQTANDCQLLLNDYSNMNVGYPNDGETSSDDYFIDDIRLLDVPIQQVDRDFYTWQTTAIRTSSNSQWLFPYHVIYRSNLVLEALEKLSSKPSMSEVNNIRGQALFFRAFSLYSVAQLYTKPYKNETSQVDLGIPLRLSSDINGKSVRGTIADTYKQIITDLMEATDLLPITSLVSSRPNKVAAFAMLARVHLTMEDYANAFRYSDEALRLNSLLIDFNTITDTTSSTPFERFNKEVIFQAVMMPGSISGPYLESGPRVASIVPSLIDQYEENDLRRKVFFERNDDGPFPTFIFTGNYEPAADSKFFTGLAIDEMFLIRAECYARVGNTISALRDLNTLLKTRWKAGTFVDLTASSSEEALKITLEERRKELLMRGLRWSDLRRLNHDPRFAKTLIRIVNGTTYSLPPNDPRYTLLIPRDVITNSGIPQNTR